MDAIQWINDLPVGTGILLIVGLWLGFRIVNLPTFADFLIAVEAEMNKVSWPSRTELIRASMVVIVLMFGLTIVLFTYDITLTLFLHTIGVVYAAIRWSGRFFARRSAT